MLDEFARGGVYMKMNCTLTPTLSPFGGEGDTQVDRLAAAHRRDVTFILSPRSSWGRENAMGTSKATAQWKGGFKTGKGTMSPAHGPEAPYSVGSRFEGQPSSNPEELVGAALAGCFSMALTLALEQQGFPSESIRTSAEVHLERVGEGFEITLIELNTEAFVPGIDGERFAAIAEQTKENCPVSKALRATTITLDARLAAEPPKPSAPRKAQGQATQPSGPPRR